MPQQNTIAKSATISGIALHSGARTSLSISPAPENAGIVFRRIDMPGAPSVKAIASNVVDVRRATTLASRETGAFVVTVEHVMAALHASCIDNAIVDMDGPEPPIADGSAAPYFRMIQDAGIQPQEAEAQYWTAKEPIVIEDKGSMLALAPADDLQITFTVQYGETPLDTQFHHLAVTTESFRDQLAGARTFCRYRELEQLITAGLAKGGSLDNAIILYEGAIISKDSLRYPNELVRHKMMDLIGDIFLVGKRVKAHIMSVKSGHPTHVQLALKMLAQEAQGKE